LVFPNSKWAHVGIVYLFFAINLFDILFVFVIIFLFMLFKLPIDSVTLVLDFFPYYFFVPKKIWPSRIEARATNLINYNYFLHLNMREIKHGDQNVNLYMNTKWIGQCQCVNNGNVNLWTVITIITMISYNLLALIITIITIKTTS
jgi:hypothetical protein